MWAGKGNPGWARFSLALEGLEINDRYSFEKKGFDPAYEVRAEVITVDNHISPNSMERGGNRPNAPIMLGHTIWLTITRAQVPMRFRGRLSCQNLEPTKCESVSSGERAWPGKLLTSSDMLKVKLN